MSCNGCRVLRKGCSETCTLRSCLRGIESPEAQGNATLFLAKFFGRSDLMSLISAVPDSQRPALFQSLLFEACGRTVNPVNGAVGLLSSGNWHVCQAAVETVLAGGVLQPIPGIIATGVTKQNFSDEYSEISHRNACMVQKLYARSREVPASDLSLSLSGGRGGGRCRKHPMQKRQRDTMSFSSDEISEMTSSESGTGNAQRKLLNLFV